jgi:hypothetical protein
MRTDHSTSSNIQITGWFMDRTTVLQQLAKLIFTFKPLWEGLPIALLEYDGVKKTNYTQYHWPKTLFAPNRFLFTEIQELHFILTI